MAGNLRGPGSAPVAPVAPVGNVAGLDAVKTYRYLRLAMICLVVLLGASVGLEWWATGRRCLQTSISAYYYTPAQGVFVGSLVAIGACLVVIKGSTEWEDLLLNIAGLLAPVVAFVPTPDRGLCRSVPVPMSDTAADVANNVGALIVLGVVGMVLTIVLARRDQRAGEWSRTSTVGVLLTVLLVVAVWATYAFARAQFLTAAHYVAAGILFVCIVAVVALNAKWFGQQHAQGATPAAGDYVNRYGVLAMLMVVSVGAMLLYRLLFGWEHALLWIEASLITLFAAFWAIQTQELWDEGLRTVRPTHTRSG